MPSPFRLFHSASSLKLGSKIPGWRKQSGSEIVSTNISQAELIDLREQVTAAHNALAQLDALLSALQDNVNEASAIPSHAEYPSSSIVAAITINLQDMKRTTESLARTLRRHAPLPPIPSHAPVYATFVAASKSTSKSRSALYPAPLRLPLRDSPTPIAPTTDIDHHPSSFDQEIRLLDSQLRQRYSLESIVTYPKVSAKRPISLPISNFDITLNHVAHSPHFSTKAKTQKLRSIQQDEPRLDEERPLSIDELLQFLRKGNSIRDL